MATGPYGKGSPYSNVPTAASDPRQIEAWGLTETALRMKAAQADPADPAAILQATRLNWRLWTILQTSLLEPNSPVPEAIRGNLLSLSNFVDRRSAAIIAEPTPDKLDALIRINQQIAGGLMTQPPSAAAAPAAPEPAGPAGPMKIQA